MEEGVRRRGKDVRFCVYAQALFKCALLGSSHWRLLTEKPLSELMILTQYTVGVKQRGARAGKLGCRSGARRPLLHVGGLAPSTSSNSVGEAPALIYTRLGGMVSPFLDFVSVLLC